MFRPRGKRYRLTLRLTFQTLEGFLPGKRLSSNTSSLFVDLIRVLMLIWIAFQSTYAY
jgi:hypothetical protein